MLEVFGFRLRPRVGAGEVGNPGAESTQPVRAEEGDEADAATVVGDPEALAETVIEESQSPIPASQPRTPTKARMHPRTPPARPSHAEFQAMRQKLDKQIAQADEVLALCKDEGSKLIEDLANSFTKAAGDLVDEDKLLQRIEDKVLDRISSGGHGQPIDGDTVQTGGAEASGEKVEPTKEKRKNDASDEEPLGKKLSRMKADEHEKRVKEQQETKEAQVLEKQKKAEEAALEKQRKAEFAAGDKQRKAEEAAAKKATQQAARDAKLEEKVRQLQGQMQGLWKILNSLCVTLTRLLSHSAHRPTSGGDAYLSQGIESGSPRDAFCTKDFKFNPETSSKTLPLPVSDPELYIRIIHRAARPRSW